MNYSLTGDRTKMHRWPDDDGGDDGFEYAGSVTTSVSVVVVAVVVGVVAVAPSYLLSDPPDDALNDEKLSHFQWVCEWKRSCGAAPQVIFAFVRHVKTSDETSVEFSQVMSNCYYRDEVTPSY